MKTSTGWNTRSISPTCEVLGSGAISFQKDDHKGSMCDLPTSIAYPAAGGGWMALCLKHGLKHLPHASRIEDLIAKGRKTDYGMQF